MSVSGGEEELGISDSGGEEGFDFTCVGRNLTDVVSVDTWLTDVVRVESCSTVLVRNLNTVDFDTVVTVSVVDSVTVSTVETVSVVGFVRVATVEVVVVVGLVRVDTVVVVSVTDSVTVLNCCVSVIITRRVTVVLGVVSVAKVYLNRVATRARIEMIEDLMLPVWGSVMKR